MKATFEIVAILSVPDNQIFSDRGFREVMEDYSDARAEFTARGYGVRHTLGKVFPVRKK